MFVSKIDISRIGNSRMRFTVDSSLIGLKTGDWPITLDTDIGTGEPLGRYALYSDCGIYRQRLGGVVVVIKNA